MLQRAVETLAHFPAIAELEKIAADLNFDGSKKWAYKTSSLGSCSQCEGCGYVRVFNPSQNFEGVVCCDDCPTGKNLQIAPEGQRLSVRQPHHIYIASGIASTRVLDKFKLKLVSEGGI